MRIVVAENYANLRWVIADRLRQDGHDVTEVADGPALFAVLASEKPDLVLCDLRLASVSGFEVLERYGKTLRIVLMSGVAVSDVRAEAMRLGARAVLQKPFDIDELLALIRRP